MAKRGPAEPGAAGPSAGKGKKKKKFRRRPPKPAAPQGPKMAAGPPRSPQEFSANWKALQEVRASCRAGDAVVFLASAVPQRV